MKKKEQLRFCDQALVSCFEFLAGLAQCWTKVEIRLLMQNLVKTIIYVKSLVYLDWFPRLSQIGCVS